MRYVVEKRSWDGTEYFVVADTSKKVDGRNRVVCSEPLEFFAYPEGAFIERVNNDGEFVMAMIAALLSASGAEIENGIS